MYKSLLIGFVLVGMNWTLGIGQPLPSIGLQEYQAGSYNGYTLFDPFFSTSVYLIDNCGNKIHEWTGNYFPAASVDLLENGHLMRTSNTAINSNPNFVFAGGGELIQELDWDSNLVWEFKYSDSLHRMHHDFKRLPNGHVIFPAWELKTREEAIAAGRDTTKLPDGVLWSETIVEVDPAMDSIVWQWHLWDHLIQDFDSTKNNYGIIKNHPELLDINLTGGQTLTGGANWLHVNTIDFNPMMNQILFSSPFISELFIIDHSTTTAQAAGHSGGNSLNGGDLLYRWGNPQNYDHGTAADQQLFGAHTVKWIPPGLPDAGKIMFFNNGPHLDGPYSSVDIINPPIDNYSLGQYIYIPGVAYGPSAAEWSYRSDPPTSLFSPILSSGQRLPNGNTLICSGANGRFFEVDTAGQIVWDYVNPVIHTGVMAQSDTVPVVNGLNANLVFRITRYGESYPGLANQDLTPSGKLEIEDVVIADCFIKTRRQELLRPITSIYPNPASDRLQLRLPENTLATLRLFDAMGREVFHQTVNHGDIEINVTHLPVGWYVLQIPGYQPQKVMISR
ncbi:MAG: aryl-sulfate sulfotransferase [Saprospiraceae bacterium]|nr:aryl-sulfate sulfotransferase [Saprospiraceae bacterium]